MINDFVAIDFETANNEPSSVCSVGIVIVKDRQVVDSFYSLIQPEPNYYYYFCQQIHGLSRADTDNAPLFPSVWADVEERISSVFPRLDWTEDVSCVPFVAHNARFDQGCLKAAFKVYQMDYPDYVFLDTLFASRRLFGKALPNHRLDTVALACGYDSFTHHHALADAEACAAIALKLL